jgi:pimeloyl-ACP methyl ester carboxylesterase
VLLHPFPLDASVWGAVRPLLAGDRPILTPEFPGLGAAPTQDEPSVDGFADAVATRIAEGVPGGRAVVAGLSLGGYVALALAARHPERVKALVLSDTRAEPDTAEAAAARRESADQVLREGAEGFLDGFVPALVAPGDHASLHAARAIAGAQRPEGIAGALRALAGRADRRPDLAAMDVPALVIVGSEDVPTPPPLAEAMAAALPDAELVVIEGAGHLTALERPTTWAAAVGDFLDRRVDGGSGRPPEDQEWRRR